MFAQPKNTNKVFSQKCYTFSDCQSTIADPWENINRKIFRFNRFLDSYLLKPITQGYDFVTPSVIQQGVNNFYKNLKEPVTVFNALLQKKNNKAGVSLTRFLINSTIGLFGIFDVAGELGLERFKEDFNQTLAVWGVESGNYVILPFFGPSSVRGALSLVGDYTVEPMSHYARGDDGIADPYTAYTNKEAKYATEMRWLEIIDKRVSFLKIEKNLLSGVADEYEFFRLTYFQNLKFNIYDGDVPEVINDEDETTNEEEDLEYLLE